MRTGLFIKQAPIATDATFSPDRLCRYSLTRVWSAGAWLCFIMLNPSRADEWVNDPTINRCVGFGRAWGFGGLSVGNLVPYRTHDPSLIPLQLARRHWEANDEVVLGLARGAGKVVAAWGADKAAVRHAPRVLALFEEHRIPLFCLGTTKGGHPRHPLYVPAATRLAPFRG